MGLFVEFVAWSSSVHAQADLDASQRAKDALIVRTLERLPASALQSRPQAKAALLRHLQTIRSTDSYFALIEKFRLTELADELLQIVTGQEDMQVAAKAAGLLVRFGEAERLSTAIANSEPAQAERLVQVLGLLSDARTNPLLVPLIENSTVPRSVRTAAVLARRAQWPGPKAAVGMGGTG